MHTTKRHGFLAGLLAVVMLFVLAATPVYAADGTAGQPTAAGTSEPSADPDTRGTYTESLGDGTSTRYAGRIWTDKTVSTGDVTFSGDVDGGSGNQVTVKKEDADFLVTYSALATSQQIIQLPKVPVDVVFVLDFSASMTWATNGTEATTKEDSRIYALVNALNETIRALQEDNPENRIGIVYFNRVGYELLPLTKLGEVQFEGDYLELTSYTLKYNENGDFTGDADCSIRCNINGETVSTDSKTNIQSGLFTGMSLLADNQDTTYTYEGKSYTRIPNVVLMSDGAPTTISEADPEGEWWSGLEYNWKTTEDGKLVGESIGWGDNDQAWTANGMMPMLTAQYMKAKISANYADASDILNPDQAAASMYTIGFSITQQNKNMVALANMVLNPAENWDKVWDETNTPGKNNSEFDIPGFKAVNSIPSLWEAYTNNQNIELQYVTVSDRTPIRELTVEHPSKYDPNTPVPDYVDDYFPADDADQLADAFQQITNAITESAKAPTKVEGGDPINSGYITYSDPIGCYMKVDDVPVILYSGEEFVRDGEPKETTADGKTVWTYKFKAKNGGNVYIDSPVYGEQNINNILVTVTQATDGSQTLEVKIPAANIPIRVNTVEVNADGTVKTNTSNGAYPIRVLYRVSLQDGVLDNQGKVNPEKVSRDYREANTNSDGTIRFYANEFTRAGEGAGAVAKATVTFTPATDNPFYYVQEDIPLFTDKNLQTPARESINENATYYFEISYYDAVGKPAQTAVIARSGQDLKGYADATGADGQLELQAGSPRLGNLNDFTKGKDTNTTNTAAERIRPTFDENEGQFVVYLGNNGVLSAAPNWQPATLDGADNLEVTKTLEGRDWQEGDSFTFKLEAADATTQAAVRNGTVVLPDNADGLTITKGTPNHKAAFGNITFSAPGTYTFQVTEQQGSQPGITYDTTPRTVTVSVTETADGKLTAAVEASSDTLTFTNTYDAEFGPEGGKVLIPVRKEMTGDRDKLLEGEEYAFTITPDTDKTEVDDSLIPHADNETVTLDREKPEDNFVLDFSDLHDKAAALLTRAETAGQTEGSEAVTEPTAEPTVAPTAEPTETPVTEPTAEPQPTVAPTAEPTAEPQPTETPAAEPTAAPTAEPTEAPATQPTAEPQPTEAPVSDGAERGRAVSAPVTARDLSTLSAEQIATLDADMARALLDQICDDYYYTITESTDQADMPGGVTKDQSVYEVKVTLGHDGKGNLTLDTTVTKIQDQDGNVIENPSPEDTEEAVFTNRYALENETDVTIEGTKELTGRDLKAGEFTFRLTDENGQEVATASNGADGNFRFDLTYTKDQIGEHKYTITEVPGDDTEITYDDAEYIVTVNVYDDQQGNLVAYVTVEGDKTIAFRNNYTPAPTPSPEVTPTPSPEVTPTPTPEATPSPTPEATPSPTPEATPSPTPEATPTPTPEATPTPTPEATPTPTPEATPTPTPEATPTPTPEATPSPTPEATPSPTPEATPSPTPEATPTPTPEATPTPTPEATPSPTPEATPAAPAGPQQTPGDPGHPDIAQGKADGTWGATPTATPAPSNTVPQTGDEFPYGLLIVLVCAAACGLGVVLYIQKRKDR